MGWLRSKSNSRTVGCFGKLPLDREFLRVNASHPEVEALDRWLQGGLAEAHQRLDGRAEGEGSGLYGEWSGCDFVFPPGERGQRHCIGHMQPSRDSAGRRYPCTAFLLVGGRDGEPTCLASLRYQSYLAGAAEVLQAGQQARDKGEWLARVRGLEAVADPRDVDFPAEESLVGRFERLLPEQELHAPVLQLLVETVVARPRGGWVVRLPIPAGDTPSLVSAWLHLLESMRPRKSVPHTALWGGDRLWVVGGTPNARTFLYLLGWVTDDRLVDATDGPTLAAAAQRVGGGVAAALESGGAGVERLANWRWE